MRQCRIIIKRLGGLQEKGRLCKLTFEESAWMLLLGTSAIRWCHSKMCFICGALKEPWQTRDSEIWGLNLFVSEVCSYSEWKFRDPYHQNLPVIPAGLSVLQQRSYPTCRGFPANHLHSLPGAYFDSKGGYHPLPTSVYSYKEWLCWAKHPLPQAALCGLDFWYHNLNSLNFLASGLSLTPGSLCFSLPCPTCWILHSVFISDHE